MKNVPLGDIATLVRGVSFSKEEGSLLPLEGHLPVIRAGSIQESLLLREGQIWVPADKIKSSQKIRIDDIVMCTSSGSSDLVGKCARSTEDFDGSFGAFCAGIRADQEKASPSYLYHFLCSPVFKNWTSASSGANIKNIRVSELAEFQVPLPSLPEQKRIAAILDKADAIRRKRQQAIQLADDFLRAVFLDMFGDPVTNPKGFRKGSITELADIITGNAFKSDEYVSDSAVAVRLCRGTNVLTSYFDWSDTAYWPKDQLDGLERYLLSSGDVILAMDRPWISSGLKVCIFPDQEVDTYLVQRVARLRPKEAMFSEYIYSCIKSQAFEKHCCPTETTVPHISPVELRGYEVLIPDKTTLANYHVTVGKIKSAITGMQGAASYAGNAFESLSQKAFSGQL